MNKRLAIVLAALACFTLFAEVAAGANSLTSGLATVLALVAVALILGTWEWRRNRDFERARLAQPELGVSDARRVLALIPQDADFAQHRAHIRESIERASEDIDGARQRLYPRGDAPAALHRAG